MDSTGLIEQIITRCDKYRKNKIIINSALVLQSSYSLYQFKLLSTIKTLYQGDVGDYN